MKFYARANKLYPVPLRQAVSGQYPKFVGRKLVLDEAQHATWPATEDPWECPDTGALANEIKREFNLCKTLGHETPLWPADTHTAELLGVTFRQVTVEDGVAKVDPEATERKVA